MTRVLWVAGEPPNRHGPGGHKRQAYLLDALSRRADVDLLLAGRLTDEQVRQACRTVTELDAAPHWRPRQLMRLARYRGVVTRRRPFDIVEFRRVRQALRSYLDPSSYDLVVIEHAELALLGPRRRAQPWVLDLHNLVSVRSEQRTVVAPGRRERLFRRLERSRAARFEATLSSRFDRILVCSAEDARRLPYPVDVVPNGVDLDVHRATPVPPGAMLVFTGHLAYPPNVAGLAWFLNEVLPQVAGQVPDVRVTAHGHAPGRELLDLERAIAGFSVDADPADIAPVFHPARAAIVPIWVGSGTRLKALEAMAAGRPVVGTSIGLEGLGIIDGVNALVADDPASFAKEIVRLLRDDDLAASIGRNGRMLAEDYGWDRIGRRYADLVLP